MVEVSIIFLFVSVILICIAGLINNKITQDLNKRVQKLEAKDDEKSIHSS